MSRTYKIDSHGKIEQIYPVSGYVIAAIVFSFMYAVFASVVITGMCSFGKSSLRERLEPPKTNTPQQVSFHISQNKCSRIDKLHLKCNVSSCSSIHNEQSVSSRCDSSCVNTESYLPTIATWFLILFPCMLLVVAGVITLYDSKRKGRVQSWHYEVKESSGDKPKYRIINHTTDCKDENRSDYNWLQSDRDLRNIPSTKIMFKKGKFKATT